MRSLYDDLSEKLKQDPRLTKRGGARFDMSLLLFNSRDDLHELCWLLIDICDHGGTTIWTTCTVRSRSYGPYLAKAPEIIHVRLGKADASCR